MLERLEILDPLGLFKDLPLENVKDPDQLSNGKMIFNGFLDLYRNPEQAQDVNELNNLAEHNVEKPEEEYDDFSMLNVRIKQGLKQDLGVDIPDGGFKEDIKIKIKTPDPLNPNDPLYLFDHLNTPDPLHTLLYALAMENVEDPNQLSNDMIFKANPYVYRNPEQAQDLNEVNNFSEKNVEKHKEEYDSSLLKVCLEKPNQALGVEIPDGVFKEKIQIKTEKSENKYNNNEIFQEDDVEGDTSEEMSEDTDIECLKSFRRHISSLHDSNKKNTVKLFQCSECTFQTMLKFSLILHMETVHDLKYRKDKLKRKSFCKEKFYSCSDCGYKTKLLKNFKSHGKSHKNCSKLYKCSMCIFSTNYKGTLRRHCLSHLKIKTFSCNVCPYSSNTKDHLKSHILKHKSDDENAYKCDKCNFKTFWKCSYTRHIKEHNSLKSSCPYCDFKCSRKYYLRRHVYNKHKNISDPHEVSIKC